MTHTQAAQYLTAAFIQVQGRQPQGNEILYCQAVAWLETHYGTAGQFVGSHNWGAIHAGNAPPCGAGEFLGQDQGPVCFVTYPDDVAGAAGFIKVLTVYHNRNTIVLPVLAGGTPDQVAAAMGASGYFTAPVAQYAAAIRNAITAIQAGGGQPATVASSVPSRGAGSILVAIVGGLALGGATFWLLEKRPLPRYLRM